MKRRRLLCERLEDRHMLAARLVADINARPVDGVALFDEQLVRADDGVVMFIIPTPFQTERYTLVSE